MKIFAQEEEAERTKKLACRISALVKDSEHSCNEIFVALTAALSEFVITNIPEEKIQEAINCISFVVLESKEKLEKQKAELEK
jgi:hypothetical protein